MKGCVLQFPLFQQLCNQATGQSDYSEQIHVVSDAPDGTPVQVQVSYVVSGRLVGTGVYSYDTHAVANSTTIPGTNGGSAGLTQTIDTPISASSTVAIGATTGAAIAVAAVCNVMVADRDCDGGSDYCQVSETSWSMSLSLSGVLTL